MNKEIRFLIDEDKYFLIAMSISENSEDLDIEMCMRWYIAKTFKKDYYEYNLETVSKFSEGVNDYHRKLLASYPYGY